MQLYSTSYFPLVGIPFLLSTYEYKETGSMMVELVHDKDGWPKSGEWDEISHFVNACATFAE